MHQEVQVCELGKAASFPLMSVRSGDGVYQQQGELIGIP
jgi:hypothetical protein